MATYTQAEIDEVIRQVNNQEITVRELEAQYGVPAAEIQANVDAANEAAARRSQIQLYQQAMIDQQARQSLSRSSRYLLADISRTPPYAPADVEKVKDLLNSGQVKVSEISQYFDVPVNDVIKNLTGISRDT